MASDSLHMILALIAGVVLGLAFYGGLWWTVREGVARQKNGSNSAALLFAGSQFIRTVFVLAGFYWVSGGDWKTLLVCLSGFIAGRVVVNRVTRQKAKDHATAGVPHAP